ncbi:MAG: class I SAM-dependent methyltransferase [bacterium]
MPTDSGSYRDPSGHVHIVDDRILRTVLPAGVSDYDFVRESGLHAALTERGQLIRGTPVSITELGDRTDARYVIEHPRLDVVTYPYEWAFPALKDAALLQLDIHLEALQRGVTLSDASAYNIMFDGPRPVFIDYLSFRRYRDGDFWAGHRQFCEQFLNPLLLTALNGVPYHDWYRGALEGIASHGLARVLHLRKKLSWNVFTHVTLQSSLQKPSTTETAAKVTRMSLPLAGLRNILGGLRSWVARLQPSPHRPTLWSGYATDNSYSTPEAQLKVGFIRKFAAAVRPGILLDLGCNTGDYSVAALEAGARSAIGWESDHGALDAAYIRARDAKLAFLPLYADPVNPSPAQGWDARERPALTERVRADAVFALAFIHHVAIARNVPLEMVIDWIIARAPNGIIEFVPKSDPMVIQLLRLREDIFDGYSEEAFLAHIQARGEIVESVRLPVSGRLLAWYRRR